MVLDYHYQTMNYQRARGRALGHSPDGIYTQNLKNKPCAQKPKYLHEAQTKRQSSMVEMIGIEPTTSALQTQRSPS